MTRGGLAIGAGLLAMAAVVVAQDKRAPSPDGKASVQVHAAMKIAANGDMSETGGQWIDITYSRPIKRGRDLWGGGADYGKSLLVGAPVWRAGANVSTRLKTEVPLVIHGKTIAPGDYSLFIDLKPKAWTLIVSNWPAQSKYTPSDKTALWGAFDYTSDKDVVRVPMKLEILPHSFEELSWQFLDMSDTGGTLAIMWDKNLASVPFTIAK